MGLANSTTTLSESLSCGTGQPRHLSDAEARFRRYAQLRLQVIGLMVVVAAASLSNLSHLTFLRTTVYNVANRSAFQAAVMPGFVQQSPNA